MKFVWKLTHSLKNSVRLKSSVFEFILSTDCCTNWFTNLNNPWEAFKCELTMSGAKRSKFSRSSSNNRRNSVLIINEQCRINPRHSRSCAEISPNWASDGYTESTYQFCISTLLSKWTWLNAVWADWSGSWGCRNTHSTARELRWCWWSSRLRLKPASQTNTRNRWN